MTITRSEMARMSAAWDAAGDVTQKPQIQAMVVTETARIHRAFNKLPIRVKFVAHDPYSSFEQMRDQVQSTGVMLVYQGASDTPLWDPKTNWMARAVHDFDHIVKSCDFSMEGEAAAFRHSAQCVPGLAPLYLSEIMLQAAVQNYTGRFDAQKLVVLPPELQRWAEQLRGASHPPVPRSGPASELPQAVWTTAGILRAAGLPATMVHLRAQGWDPNTAFVLADAAKRLNAQVDSGAAPGLAGRGRSGPPRQIHARPLRGLPARGLGAAKTWTGETGHEEGYCEFCESTCSTHPDAGACLERCADCNALLCNHCAKYVKNAPRCPKCVQGVRGVRRRRRSA